MARIEPEDVQAWVEESKLAVSELDLAMLSQIEAQRIGQLTGAFGSEVTDVWVDVDTTPTLIRSLIAMYYASWLYNKFYSEDQDALNNYALWLFGQANDLMTALISGAIVIPDVILPSTGSPSFYPNDASSALEPTSDDTSLGDASFSVGKVF
jgi:hypothetical protein